MLRAIDISTSGLVAQRQRLNTIAGNIANVHTTRDADGNAAPFQRRLVTFAAAEGTSLSDSRGIGVEYQVEIDTSRDPRRAFEPGHPDADEQGFVSYPDIDVISEYVNAMEASRAYEANVTVIEMSKEMANLGMRILA